MARLRAPERRRQLLEVAAGVFAERGYTGATTAELAAAAGVTEPILYRHFASKRDLFVTLIEEVGAEVVSAWRARLAAIDDAHDRLRALLAGNPATHARGAGVYRVILHAMTEPGPDDADEIDPVADALRDHVRTLHRFLAGELRRLQVEGAVRDDAAPADLARLLVHVAVGVGTVGTIGRSGPGGRAHELLEVLLAP